MRVTYWVAGVRETNGQGLIQIDQQKLQQARQMEQRALAQNDSLALGKAYFMIGEIINQAGSNSTAKEYYLKAFRTLKPIGDSYELGLIYLRLTEGLELTQQSVEDIDYAQKALGVFERIQSPVGIARAHNYLTSAYKRKWLWLRIGSNLLKPFRQVELVLQVELAYMNRRVGREAARSPLESNELFLPINGGYERIDKTKVTYLKAMKAYTGVYVVDRPTPHVISMNLGNLEPFFADPFFYKLSRSVLINLHYLDRVEYKQIVMRYHTGPLALPENNRVDLMKKITLVRTRQPGR